MGFGVTSIAMDAVSGVQVERLSKQPRNNTARDALRNRLIRGTASTLFRIPP
jgi:hypothetical protein